MMERMGNAYKILVRKLERKRLLRRLRQRWKDNIEMAHKEIGCEDVDIVHPLSGSCDCSNEPLGFIEGGVGQLIIVVVLCWQRP
jgi:hypothetical protein